jgi:mRNA-degrading endonuclease RelE of RelBE toxin-antitoxin system
MRRIVFTPRGERELAALPRDVQRRIHRKLQWLAQQAQPLAFAKPLVNLPPSTHRFRIGLYRVSFSLEASTIFVERVESRGQAYRR